jgi:dsDNA-specific endonuclease/ATPase MutS2
MKTGDRVSAIDDTVTGVITRIEGNVITVLTEDDFVLQYSEKELIIVENLISDEMLNFNQISDIISQKEGKKPKKVKKVRSKDRNLPPMEVDLHIHQLVNNHSRMSNHDMLTLQLDTATRQLDFAISKRIQRIVFIHGLGEGVLRTELEFLLNRYENLKFYDADFQKYGQGAVEVYIFQSKNT